MIALVALIAVINAYGALDPTYAAVAGAARAAARQVSAARDPHEEIPAAEETARAGLPLGSRVCRSATVTTTLTELEVTVRVTCVVDLSSASVLPVPGSVSVSRSATEVIDQYRETSP